MSEDAQRPADDAIDTDDFGRLLLAFHKVAVPPRPKRWWRRDEGPTTALRGSFHRLKGRSIATAEWVALCGLRSGATESWTVFERSQVPAYRKRNGQPCEACMGIWKGLMWEAGAERFEERQGTSVASWSDCPFCAKPLSTVVDHAASCQRCDRYYTDPTFQPVVNEAPGRFGELLGAERLAILDSDLPYIERNWSYILKPRPTHPGPAVVHDWRLGIC
jgi:hypothetical protein